MNASGMNVGANAASFQREFRYEAVHIVAKNEMQRSRNAFVSPSARGRAGAAPSGSPGSSPFNQSGVMSLNAQEHSPTTVCHLYTAPEYSISPVQVTECHFACRHCRRLLATRLPVASQPE